MNYRMISYILGWILIFEGLFLSVPMLTAIVYGESVLPSYLIAMGICFLIGGLLVFKKPKKKQLFAGRFRHSSTRSLKPYPDSQRPEQAYYRMLKNSRMRRLCGGASLTGSAAWAYWCL